MDEGEPKMVTISDSDVINKEPRVLLCGIGWVGQFCNAYFPNADIVNSKGYVKKDYDHYDLAIISVPTPMNPETGECDTSIVEECLCNYLECVDIFLIKSTVSIGTCDRLSKELGADICMSPEYIGETLGHKLVEPKRDTFIIIGGKKDVREKVAFMWESVLHADSTIFLCDAIEAEVIKYMENYWIMRRVDYWNDVYDMSLLYGVSFNTLREGLVLDPRLGRTHSFVYPDNRGWGGKCLPKDMNALAYQLKKIGAPNEVLEQLIDKNANRRKHYRNNNLLKPEGGA